MASSYGHKGVVEVLLGDPRVDPFANNNEAIFSASHRGHAGVVKLLLNHGAPITLEATRCLQRAAKTRLDTIRHMALAYTAKATLIEEPDPTKKRLNDLITVMQQPKFARMAHWEPAHQLARQTIAFL